MFLYAVARSLLVGTSAQASHARAPHRTPYPRGDASREVVIITSIRFTARPRAAIITIVALAVLGGFAAIAVWPAWAAPHPGVPSSVQLGYTDAANPGRAFDWREHQNLPLGTRVDNRGKVHTSRVYVTYNVSAFIGKHIVNASVRVDETSVADCSKRAIEVWQTRVLRATPKWNDPPRVIDKQDEILTVEACPAAFLALDVTDALARAAAQGRARVSFEIRVPAAFETDPSYYREINWATKVPLTVEYNTPPTIDNTSLVNAGYPCGEADLPTQAGGLGSQLAVIANDSDELDSSVLTLRFAVWPSTDPTAVTEFTTDFVQSGIHRTGNVPDGVLVDGLTYAWRVNVTDGVDTSDWSTTCYFTYDISRPPAPTVTSSNYPEFPATGPLGEPALFEFSGDGDPDVAAFQYTWDGMLPVPGSCVFVDGRTVCTDPLLGEGVLRLETPGGTAVVALNPPQPFISTLTVRAIDRAGNVSDETEYAVRPPMSQPTVTTVEPPVRGQPVSLLFTPRAGVVNVISYQVTINGGEQQTVPAAADGSASITFVAAEDSYDVDVRSVSQNGFVSLAASFFLAVDP